MRASFLCALNLCVEGGVRKVMGSEGFDQESTKKTTPLGSRGRLRPSVGTVIENEACRTAI